MNEELFKKLTGTIHTVQDLHSVLRILGNFFDTYFSKEDKETSLYKAFTLFVKDSEEAKNLGDVWKGVDTNFLNSFTKENNNAVLHALEDIGRNAPHVVLYVPVLFPYKEIKKLSDWVRKNIGREVFMDMKVDVLSVGGCNIIWNGLYYDYSMQYFIGKKRSEIREMIRSIKQ